MTWKYGDFDVVTRRVSIDHTDPDSDTVIDTLLEADAYIDTAITENGLILPLTPPYEQSLVQCAILYATGSTLKTYTNADEEENKTVTSYLDQADNFLESYITIELNKKANNGTANGPNPYSVSQSCIPHPRRIKYRPYFR